MTLTSVPGIRVGHSEVPGGGSGCTVILGPFRGAVEIRGMATGTRELDVLSQEHLADHVHAVLLSGGSAFGLGAAEGVMEWLAERGEGFETGVTPVPLVPGAVIFDLAPDVGRPGPTEGQEACREAGAGPVPEGRVGAGSGARVGKVLGVESSSPGGVGSASRSWGGGTLGALAVVNALGDVVARDGSVLAGVVDKDGDWAVADAVLMGEEPILDPLRGTNTTLVVVATDLPLSRVQLGGLAKMASAALPRAISPVNTPFDGDVLFALSTSEKEEPLSPEELLRMGVSARDLVEQAIRRSVKPPNGPDSRSLRTTS